MKLRHLSVALTGVLLAATSLVVSPASAVSLSQQQLGVVANNCYVGQVGMQHLRRDDVVLRINLGNLYGAVVAQASAFTTRLGNDNVKSKAITSTTQLLNSSENQFQNDFNNYAILLENGLSLNCASNPQQFYNILTETQEARADTNRDVQSLNQQLGQYIQEISALKPPTSGQQGATQ
ncbi:MAG TPA: hypothetical protein VGS28_04025 [Candidatus Saccharimonadales bacterium]|nr:hypothetical protein [Candidatus Saccharimonadales bacterium]